MNTCDKCPCIGNSFCYIENGEPKPDKCLLMNGGPNEKANIQTITESIVQRNQTKTDS